MVNSVMSVSALSRSLGGGYYLDIPVKKLANGFSLPAYGLGTWQMGGRFDRDPRNDDAADISAIRAALSLGITHIDTAEIYAQGHAEKLIASALEEERIDRANIVLVSKVAADHQSYDGIRAACQQTLQRLHTPYLDVYLLHKYAQQFPLDQAVRAMNDLQEEGLVRNIGVSNFGIHHLQQAQESSKTPIVCDQVHYSLHTREAERNGLLAYCQKNDVMLVAYRPLEKGALLARAPAVLEELCQKYKKTAAQVALQWLIVQQNVVTIVKTKDVHHLQENLGAVGWHMRPEDIDLLRTAFPGQADISDTISLG